MPSLQAVRSSNATFRPSFRPVALFVGGTSGIGQAAAEGFARYTNGDAHIILCGRNKAAAESIIAGFPKSPNSTYEFLSCDVTLMSSIRAATADLSSRLTKLNYLVLSPGILTMQGRTETSEGIDKKLALHYFGRWKFVFELMPLLKKAKESGEEARVMTILGSGQGGAINLDDFYLKKGYGLKAAADHAITGSDIMVEEFAKREPTISFTHIYPGVVRTPLISSSLPGRLLSPLMYLFGVSPSDCAEWMLYPLFAKEFERGAFWRNNHAEDVGRNRYSTEETRRGVWEKTIEIAKIQVSA